MANGDVTSNKEVLKAIKNLPQQFSRLQKVETLKRDQNAEHSLDLANAEMDKRHH